MILRHRLLTASNISISQYLCSSVTLPKNYHILLIKSLNLLFLLIWIIIQNDINWSFQRDHGINRNTQVNVKELPQIVMHFSASPPYRTVLIEFSTFISAPFSDFLSNLPFVIRAISDMNKNRNVLACKLPKKKVNVEDRAIKFVNHLVMQCFWVFSASAFEHRLSIELISGEGKGFWFLYGRKPVAKKWKL